VLQALGRQEKRPAKEDELMDGAGSYPSEVEGLWALSLVLANVAKKSEWAMQNMLGDWPTSDEVLWGQADIDPISVCLRHVGQGGSENFSYLGEFNDLTATNQAAFLQNFRPTTSFQLFDLVGDMMKYVALQMQLQNPKLNAARHAFLEQTLIRANVLTATVGYTWRFLKDREFEKLTKGEPGTDQHLMSLRQTYEEYTREKILLLGDLVRSKQATELTEGMLIALPAALSVKRTEDQRTLNGVYFPPEHEAKLLQSMSVQPG
jgi:hypothetical protein